MRVVIIGASQAGTQVARALLREKAAVTFLERNETVLRSLIERFDCKVVRGSGTDLASLKEAEVAEADFVLVLTESDEVNLTCCYVIFHYFPQVKTIMRLRNTTTETASVIQQTMSNGCLVLNPVKEVAQSICDMIGRNNTGLMYNFFDDTISLASIEMTANHRFIGHTIAAMRHRSVAHFIIPFIRRDNQIDIPSGETTIQEDDTIYIAFKKEDSEHFLPAAAKKNHKKLVFLGGNEITIETIRILRNKHQNYFSKFIQRVFRQNVHDIKIVEKDYERCKYLKANLPEVEVIHADITEENIFQEEGLSKADLLIAVSNNSELNIITALYAKRIGIGASVVAVRNRNLLVLAGQLKLDLLISPGTTIVNAVLSHLHEREIRRILSIADGSDAEILEIEVQASSSSANKAIRDIKLPPKTLIGFIYRNKVPIIPDGSAIIREGDQLIVITRQEFIEPSRLAFSADENSKDNIFLNDSSKEP